MYSPIKVNEGLIFLTLLPAIYCNFKSETEKFVHTISGILENFKKPGLVKEALGKLGDLTRH
jgi:hypothetical protein